jgi:hypothetical protein
MRGIKIEREEERERVNEESRSMRGIKDEREGVNEESRFLRG